MLYKSPVVHLERNPNGKLKCVTEEIIGPKLLSLIVRLLARQTCYNIDTTDAEYLHTTMSIRKKYQAMEMMHKEVSKCNRSRCKREQIFHNINS